MHTSAMMSNSGRKINYAVRPAKNVERKMMRDLFIRLRSFGRLEDYRYVGFGSKYFSDFILFHKILNISEMISIESDVNNRARYEFNKPYSGISMEWGRSTDVLPKLVAKQGKSIYWMDYDGSFEQYMLEDVAIISEKIESGGVLALSFNCQPLKIDEKNGENDLHEQLIKMVGKEYVANNTDTRGWKSSKKLAIFLKNCVTDKISLVLKRRNYSLSEKDKLEAMQKLFFTYADGAPMATIAYVFSSKVDREHADSCRFSDLYFVREADEPFDINTPNFTIKEIRHLMELRPYAAKVDDKIFASKDVEALWENYRYFPGFSEIESF
jgi:hypothetical protein